MLLSTAAVVDGISDILNEVVGIEYVFVVVVVAAGAVKAEVEAAMVAIATMEVESFMVLCCVCVVFVVCCIDVEGRWSYVGLCFQVMLFL